MNRRLPVIKVQHLCIAKKCVILNSKFQALVKRILHNIEYMHVWNSDNIRMQIEALFVSEVKILHREHTLEI